MSDELIVSTKDRPGSYDAIETAKPGEPLFPIQGGDPFGPPTVLHWVKLCREAGRAEQDDKKADKLLRKATDAEQVAWAMQAYQRGHVDEEAARTSYTGHQIEVDETTDHNRKVREARIKGAARLHNLVGMGADIADTLEGLETCETGVYELRNAIEKIQRIAAEVEPRRGREQS